MNINVIAVGKIKERYYTDAVAEYAKRLSKYCKLNIIEVTDEKTPDRSSTAQEEQIKQKEAERIFRYLKDDAYVISLEIDGEMIDSVQLANKIDATGISGTSHIIFIIGGSLGLHHTISERADFHLSFSKMTFPHQMMRVVLLEQVYRSYRIINQEPYHK